MYMYIHVHVHVYIEERFLMFYIGPFLPPSLPSSLPLSLLSPSLPPSLPLFLLPVLHSLIHVTCKYMYMWHAAARTCTEVCAHAHCTSMHMCRMKIIWLTSLRAHSAHVHVPSLFPPFPFLRCSTFTCGLHDDLCDLLPLVVRSLQDRGI